MSTNFPHKWWSISSNANVPVITFSVEIYVLQQYKYALSHHSTIMWNCNLCWYYCCMIDLSYPSLLWWIILTVYWWKKILICHSLYGVCFFLHSKSWIKDMYYLNVSITGLIHQEGHSSIHHGSIMLYIQKQGTMARLPNSICAGRGKWTKTK